jgi:hypothetical protein
VQWTLWGAITASAFIYLAVGFITSRTSAPPTGIDLKLMRWVLLGVAFADTAMILVLSRALASKIPFFNYCIIRWAMAEAIAVFGLVLMVMGDTLAAGALFVGWAVAVLAALAPTEGARRRFQEQQAPSSYAKE